MLWLVDVVTNTTEPWRTTDYIVPFAYIHLIKIFQTVALMKVLRNYISMLLKKRKQQHGLILKHSSILTQANLWNDQSFQNICLPLVHRKTASICLESFYVETLSVLKVHPNLENNNRTVKFTAKFLEVWKNINVYTPTVAIKWRSKDSWKSWI